MVGLSVAMTEAAIETAKEVAKKPFEQAGEFKNPFAQKGELSAEGKSNLTKPTLEGRVEATAHDASEFYKIPLEDLCNENALETYRECESLTDVIKNIEHEGGRSIAQQEFPDKPREQELMTDFFAGVRSEMRGLPKSGFDDKLKSTEGPLSHINGNYRNEAIQKGREVVQNLRKEGIEPTVEICKEEFMKSNFANTVETGNHGGRYGDLKEKGLSSTKTIPKTDIHHMPAKSVSPLEREDGPAIVMDYHDHRETASCGGSPDAREYQYKQKELIKEGKFREAFQMDVDDIRSKFGDKYDEAISKAESYIDKLEKEGKI